MQPCEECGKQIPEKRARRLVGPNADGRKFCSHNCRRQADRKAWRAANPISGLASATVGAINEFRVGIDLLLRGYEVFRALSPACSCDLAVLKDGRLLRVEVTTGYRNKSGKIGHPVKTKPHDLLAVVVRGTIYYTPDLP